MTDEKMTVGIMEYMVWVVEITSREYFSGDKGAAYRALHSCGIWDFYVEHYDVTHTLGVEAILDEIREWLTCKDKVIT